MFLGFIVLKLRKMYPVQDRPADMFVIGGGKAVSYTHLARVMVRAICATSNVCVSRVRK